jgi:hypothetical protein
MYPNSALASGAVAYNSAQALRTENSADDEMGEFRSRLVSGHCLQMPSWADDSGFSSSSTEFLS